MNSEITSVGNDINAARMVEGEPLNQVKIEMMHLMIREINGEKTRAEANGMDVFTLMTVHPPF